MVWLDGITVYNSYIYTAVFQKETNQFICSKIGENDLDLGFWWVSSQKVKIGDEILKHRNADATL